MSFTLHGIPVSRGIAIGRAHLLAAAALEVAHYLVPLDKVEAEIARLEHAISTVVEELYAVEKQLSDDAPAEFAALLELHRLILQDPLLSVRPQQLIRERLYNAEWALTTQLNAVVEQFEKMEDEYIASRKADVEQVVERVLKNLMGTANAFPEPVEGQDEMIVVSHDIAPADMLQFKKKVFGGFATDLGGVTSHTAILARSLDIPAVVGLGMAARLIQQDEWLIVDGDAGVIIVDPSSIVLEEYRLKHRDLELGREKLKRLRGMASRTVDDVPIELLANIELPGDCEQANEVGASGVGLYRTEFLFMNRNGNLPNEDEQFEAYRSVVTAMTGRPVTIRTLDIGADKPFDSNQPSAAANPALGLRAIRYCLSEPQMFLEQLRAILRASAFGPIKLLIPMVAHAHEVDQALNLIEQAKTQLTEKGIAFDHDIPVGGMIEIPAAALTLPMLAKRLDFFSIGTNDLIQYTLAIDRTDNAVAHLYDPLHPAILQLIAQTIQTCARLGLEVSVCGEMAGDTKLARLLLGMGLRQFSMHPAQLLSVKQEILRSDTTQCAPLAKRILSATEPEKILGLIEKLRAV